MFNSDLDEKIFQTLPGQGWRVLINWDPYRVDGEDDFPAVTLEPVVAWVTARIQRERKRDGYKYEDVIIAPLVRYPSGDELVLMDSREISPCKFVYVAPGEELSEQHFNQLRGGYAKGVTVQCGNNFALKSGTRLNPELASTVGLWGYIGCHRPENMSTNGAHITHDCGACDNRNLRFVHTLYQPDDLELGQLEVCVECARILIGDVEWDIPGDAENELRGKL